MSTVATARPVFGDLTLIAHTTLPDGSDHQRIDELSAEITRCELRRSDREKEISDLQDEIDGIDSRLDEIHDEREELEAIASRDRDEWRDPPYGTTAAPSGQPDPEWPDPPYGYPLTGPLVSEEDDIHL